MYIRPSRMLTTECYLVYSIGWGLGLGLGLYLESGWLVGGYLPVFISLSVVIVILPVHLV